jgi:hypothetical protein
MSDWSCELDMTSTLTADLRGRHFHSTSFTYDALVSDTLIFATGALIVLAWTKNLFTEESSTLRALSTIVDGLRDEDLTIGECSYIITRGESY